MNGDYTKRNRRRITQSAVPEDWASWSSRLNPAQFFRSPRYVSVNVVAGLAWILLLLCTPTRLIAAELKPKTLKAFNQYVQKAELRMQEQLKPGGPFLWIDTLSSADRTAAYARLRDGGIFVHPFAAGLDVPGGMIHDWIGIAFIPNATLDETLAQIQNYNAYARIYSPEVARSKTLDHDGNDFTASLWLQQKSLMNVVLNDVEHVQYFRLDSSHVYSSAHSIRIVEVQDSGTSTVRDHSDAAGHGYLWRLNGYGWFLQTPSGVYIQLEAIALSRNIPWGLEWLIKLFVTRIPRDSLMFTLARARASLAAAGQPAKIADDTPSGTSEENSRQAISTSHAAGFQDGCQR
jgi:hypothetical protein